MTGFHIAGSGDWAEDVEEFCLVSHVGEGTTHSIAHSSNFCMSPCHVDFHNYYLLLRIVSS